MELNKNELKLPSGKILRADPSTFDKGKHLYQTVMREAKNLGSEITTDIDETLIFRLGMLALSSETIEKAIWECVDKTLIDGDRVTKAYFEVVENRDDYFTFLFEVAKVNIAPFTKSLFAQFKPLLEALMKKNQA